MQTAQAVNRLRCRTSMRKYGDTENRKWSDQRHALKYFEPELASAAEEQDIYRIPAQYMHREPFQGISGEGRCPGSWSMLCPGKLKPVTDQSLAVRDQQMRTHQGTDIFDDRR